MTENSDFLTAQEKLLKASDVSRILNVSRAMAYRLMQQGDIRSVRIAGSRRVRVEDLQTFINDNLYPPIPGGLA